MKLDIHERKLLKSRIKEYKQLAKFYKKRKEKCEKLAIHSAVIVFHQKQMLVEDFIDDLETILKKL